MPTRICIIDCWWKCKLVQLIWNKWTDETLKAGLAYVAAKWLYVSSGSKSICHRDAHTALGTASFTKVRGLNQSRCLTTAGGCPKVGRAL